MFNTQNIEFSNLNITNNKFATKGGAIYIENTDKITLKHSIVA